MTEALGLRGGEVAAEDGPQRVRPQGFPRRRHASADRACFRRDPQTDGTPVRLGPLPPSPLLVGPGQGRLPQLADDLDDQVGDLIGGGWC